MEFYQFILTTKHIRRFIHTQNQTIGAIPLGGDTYNKRCILSNQQEITNDYRELSRMSSTRSLR